jgi:hypothetical protein
MNQRWVITACTTGLIVAPMRSANARKGSPSKGSDAACCGEVLNAAASKRLCRRTSGVGSLKSAPICKLKACNEKYIHRIQCVRDSNVI